ncbi:hypothetical protein BD560DRAFT_428999 [Blakeslea trispora]|nr:hypothetical protein BD560DRAFT_428999 [Blakeslea trispora]
MRKRKFVMVKVEDQNLLSFFGLELRRRVAIGSVLLYFLALLLIFHIVSLEGHPQGPPPTAQNGNSQIFKVLIQMSSFNRNINMPSKSIIVSNIVPTSSFSHLTIFIERSLQTKTTVIFPMKKE